MTSTRSAGRRGKRNTVEPPGHRTSLSRQSSLSCAQKCLSARRHQRPATPRRGGQDTLQPQLPEIQKATFVSADQP
eukprot:1785602-Amphidinium_carterae.1